MINENCVGVTRKKALMMALCYMQQVRSYLLNALTGMLYRRTLHGYSDPAVGHHLMNRLWASTVDVSTQDFCLVSSYVKILRPTFDV